MKNPVKAIVVIATSAVLFGVLFPIAGGSVTQLLGSQSTVGGCSTVGGKARSEARAPSAANRAFAVAPRHPSLATCRPGAAREGASSPW